MNKMQQGFTLNRTDDRRRDHRYLGGNCDPGVSGLYHSLQGPGGLALSSEAKTAVSETAASLGGLANVTAANSGFTFPAGGTDYVSSIAIADNTGVITVTMGGTKGTGAATEPVFTLTPTQVAVEDPLTWVCALTAGAARHVPGNCR